MKEDCLIFVKVKKYRLNEEEQNGTKAHKFQIAIELVVPYFKM